MKKNMYGLCEDLFPINRSITGDGVRETFDIIKSYLPELQVTEVPSGTKCFDWEIPREWKIRDAYIIDPTGKKIADFKKNNLHVVGYSVAVDQEMSLDELRPKLFSKPDLPDAIPYYTSYYKEDWGFCISENEKKQLKDGNYKVYIDSELFDGSLTYGEIFLEGKTKKEVFLSTYICHPSMANNELSGPLVATELAKYFISLKSNSKTLRFIFVPETIGSIVYLNKNLKKLKNNVIAGYNISCIGDERQYSYLPTKYGKSLSDKAAKKAFQDLNVKYVKYSFLQRGSDERQYNSPGIDLPIASIFRTKYGEYPEYHTSLDNFNLVTKKGLRGGYDIVKKAIDIVMESRDDGKFKSKVYRRLKKSLPKNKFLCEPQLTKRGLYPHISKFDNSKSKFTTRNFLNFLQYADGSNNLTNISNYIKISLDETCKIFKLMLKFNLIKL